MSKEAIEQIKKELSLGQLEELYLDDIQIQTITLELKKEIEKLTELMCLSLNNCGLTSLVNFPNKLTLIRLEVMENKFPAKELVHIAGIVSLQSLSLGSNKIVTIQDLAPLKSLENLIQLDLSDTEFAKTADYRKAVFELIPNLQVLDNLDVEGNEYEYSSDDNDEEDNGDFDAEDDEDGDEFDDDEDEDGEEGDDDGEDDEEDDDEDDEEDDEEEDEVPANKRRK